MSQFEDQYHFINDTLDRAIETSLKEYETLRSEIAQRSQNIIQFVFLGLAAITTIISFTLPQFVTFVTSEDITIQSTSENKDSLILNLEIPENEATITVPRSEGEEYDQITVTLPKNIDLNLSHTDNNFKINRTTEATGAVSAKWVFTFVFGFIIPLLCFYVLHAVMKTARGIAILGNYLAYEVESKINHYFSMKQEIFTRLQKKWRKEVKSNTVKDDTRLSFQKPLSWELSAKKIREFTIGEYLYIYIFFAFIAFGAFNFAVWIISFVVIDNDFQSDSSFYILCICNILTLIGALLLILLFILVEQEIKYFIQRKSQFSHINIANYLWAINVFLLFVIFIRLIEQWLLNIQENLSSNIHYIYQWGIFIAIIYQIILTYYLLRFCNVSNIFNLKHSYTKLEKYEQQRTNSNLILLNDLRKIIHRSNNKLFLVLYYLPIVQILIAIVIFFLIHSK